MPGWSITNTQKRPQILTKVILKVQSDFPSGMVQGYVGQATTVAYSRLDLVPHILRALDVAIMRSVIDNCPEILRVATDGPVDSHGLNSPVQLTGIAMLAFMLEALGINDASQKWTRMEKNAKAKPASEKDPAGWFAEVNRVNNQFCFERPNKEACEKIAQVLNDQLETAGRRLEAPKFVAALEC